MHGIVVRYPALLCPLLVLSLRVSCVEKWLGFFNGPAETTQGHCTTREPDGGSAELGVRHVLVELQLEASSSRLRTVRRTVTQLLEEAMWQSPLSLSTVLGRGSSGEDGVSGRVDTALEPLFV